VVAATAALALALAPASRAEEADSSASSRVATTSEVVSAAETRSEESADATEEPVVEIPFDDVPVGDAPDIAARVKYTQDLQRRGLSEFEARAIENNQKIKQYNNAPEEFPTFVREGYDVRVLTADGFITQDDGLVYKDFVVGVGDLPVDGQEVTFEYVAYNENGGAIDSTYRKGVPASTRLGIKGMIPGFEEGLKGMRPGGKRRVVVPPELGPPTGPATFFSAKQWEVFDIELLGVKNCSRVQSSFMSSSVVCE
jgi:FKBP-type peptidyl-prolyl cis-trans isomerase